MHRKQVLTQIERRTIQRGNGAKTLGGMQEWRADQPDRRLSGDSSYINPLASDEPVADMLQGQFRDFLSA